MPMESPKTLQDAILYFSDYDNCRRFMVAIRWQDGIVRCPRCESDKVAYIEKSRVYWCKGKHDHQKFSLKVGTVFEDSPIPLQKWLPALWMLVNDKNGISSYELHRAIKVTQKSAWFMLHRIREAVAEGGFGKQFKIGNNEGGGGVEIDETFVGGKVQNMHKDKRIEMERIRGEHRHPTHKNKTIVMGMLDRDMRQVRAKVVPNVKRETLQAEVLNHVKYGSRVFTDEWGGYINLHEKFVHDVVNHMETYVNGVVHTNGIENFWSLFKRTLRGTYVAVEPYHLQRYADEQAFRFNYRGGKRKEQRVTDDQRFKLALSRIVGKRLTYSELTGKEGETAF
jgi:transposase-like protein